MSDPLVNSSDDEDPEEKLAEDFEEKLAELLLRHNKTIGDIPGAAPPVPEKVPKEVVEHIHRIQDGGSQGRSYRRLRTFSGKYPVPNGELPFSSWVQHAQQMIDECGLKEEERRARLAEGLIPPALTLYRKSVQALGPSASAADLLAQLGHAYGVACEGEDLFSLFRETYQEVEERPSDYLARLEEKLDQAIQFGGIPASDANKLRISQFIRGSIYSESLVAALQLRQRRSSPPGLVKLLKEVRVEEAAEEARSRRRLVQGPTRKAHSRQLHAEDAEVPSLTTEVDNLKAQVKAMQVQPPVRPPTTSNPQGQDVAALLATVEELKQTIARLTREKSSGMRSAPSKKGYLCYKCGEKGHISRECPNPANAELVQRRLLERC